MGGLITSITEDRQVLSHEEVIREVDMQPF